MKKPIDVQIAQELYGDDWKNHLDYVLTKKEDKDRATQIMQQNISEICNRCAEIMSDHAQADTVYLAFAFKRVYEILLARLDESDMQFFNDLSEFFKVDLYSAVVDVQSIQEMLGNKDGNSENG